jgi:polyisoprenoid-binding protein YceI
MSTTTSSIEQNGVATATDMAVTTWKIDAAASRVEFAVRKRLMFVKRLTVVGRFTDVSGTLHLDPRNPTAARASVTIGAASVDTKNARRDKHLRTKDFFEVDRYPAIDFASRSVAVIDQGAGTYRVTGDLTVRGITREVVLSAQYSPARGGRSDSRLKLDLATTLNRRDFGIVWNKAAINVADELAVTLAIEAVPA